MEPGLSFLYPAIYTCPFATYKFVFSYGIFIAPDIWFCNTCEEMGTTKGTLLSLWQKETNFIVRDYKYHTTDSPELLYNILSSTFCFMRPQVLD